jgi:diguanylate cyclase (GGDEF)-like protein
VPTTISVKPLDPDQLRVRLIAAARVTSLQPQLARQRAHLERLNLALASAVLKDPLTGLGNRRALKEDLDLLDARVQRHGHRNCMALLDVDDFKAYNDTYGHQAGDEALQVVASQLKYHGRAGDAIYRYGGEDFLCIQPEPSLAVGTHVVERMRTGLERLAIVHLRSSHSVLTISAGIALLDSEHVRGAQDVLKNADDALYRAKQLGRNRVEHQLVEPNAVAAAGAVSARTDRRRSAEDGRIDETLFLSPRFR